MPGPSIAEAIVAAIAAIGAGAGGVALGRRRPVPGSPADVDERLADLERVCEEHGKLTARVAHMEAQVQLYGERLTQAFDRLSESNDLIRRAVEIMGEKLDRLRDTVVRIDVETTTERELRRQRQSAPNLENPR